MHVRYGEIGVKISVYQMENGPNKLIGNKRLLCNQVLGFLSSLDEIGRTTNQWTLQWMLFSDTIALESY
jgi:hypothetical protein